MKVIFQSGYGLAPTPRREDNLPVLACQMLNATRRWIRHFDPSTMLRAGKAPYFAPNGRGYAGQAVQAGSPQGVKKNRPKTGGRGRKVKKFCALLTQGDIACNRQNQNPLFVKYKWKPSFVIKFTHHPSRKQMFLTYYADMITEMGVEVKGK